MEVNFLDKEELKKIICNSIDLANENDISYYSKDHIYTSITQYGGFIYKPSGKKEISINIIIDRNDR